MRARFQVSTDTARLGAWDAQRGEEPFSREDVTRSSEALGEDVAAGHVAVLSTKADAGGRIDVYVDELVPNEVRADLTPIEGEFLLVLASGKLVVDGVEYYRPRPSDNYTLQPAVPVPAGDYAARWYRMKDPEASPKSEADLVRKFGREEVEYFDRMNQRGCLTGVSTLLLLPILWYLWGFWIALPVTLVVFVGYFHVKQWVLKRNARYWRLQEVIPAYRHEHEDPLFVLELRRVDKRAGLTGGTAVA
jgi:hypothetical protein